MTLYSAEEVGSAQVHILVRHSDRRFNQAQIMMCDFAMLTGDADRVGPANGTRLHFRGLKLEDAKHKGGLRFFKMI